MSMTSPPKVKTTPAQKAYTQMGAEQYAQSQRLRPVLTGEIARAMDSAPEMQRATNAASNAYAVQQSRVMSAAPAAPTSLSAAMRLGQQGAAAGALAPSAVRSGQVSQLSGLSGVLQGQQSRALQAQGGIARNAEADAQQAAANKQSQKMANLGLLSGGAGIGTALGMGFL